MKSRLSEMKKREKEGDKKKARGDFFKRGRENSEVQVKDNIVENL